MDFFLIFPRLASYFLGKLSEVSPEMYYIGISKNPQQQYFFRPSIYIG
jgi:hypothetical protein